LNLDLDIVNLGLHVVNGVGLSCVEGDHFAVKGGPNLGPRQSFFPKLVSSLRSDRLGSVSLFIGGRKRKKKDARRKKIVFVPAFRDVGRRSLALVLSLLAEHMYVRPSI
jgi:hypothetical protein